MTAGTTRVYATNNSDDDGMWEIDVGDSIWRTGDGLTNPDRDFEVTGGRIVWDYNPGRNYNFDLGELFEKMIYFDRNYAVFLLEDSVVAFKINKGSSEQTITVNEVFRAKFEGEKLDLEGLPNEVKSKISKAVL